MQTLRLDEDASGPGAVVFVAQGLGCARLLGLLLTLASLGVVSLIVGALVSVAELGPSTERVLMACALAAAAFAGLCTRLGRPFGWRIERLAFHHDDGVLRIRERRRGRVLEASLAYDSLAEVLTRPGGRDRRASILLRRRDGGVLPVTSVGSQMEAEAVATRIRDGMQGGGETSIPRSEALHEERVGAELRLSWGRRGWFLGTLLAAVFLGALTAGFVFATWGWARWLAWPAAGLGAFVVLSVLMSGLGKVFVRGALTITPVGVRGPRKGLLFGARPEIGRDEIAAVRLLPSSTGSAALLLLRDREVALMERLVTDPLSTLGSSATWGTLRRMFGVQAGALGIIELLDLERRVQEELGA